LKKGLSPRRKDRQGVENKLLLPLCSHNSHDRDPIHARYERLLGGGTKPTLAKVSLARMIAATVLRMWKDEEEYDPGRGGPMTAPREG
jgi:hypothetical protein